MHHMALSCWHRRWHEHDSPGQHAMPTNAQYAVLTAWHRQGTEKPANDAGKSSAGHDLQRLVVSVHHMQLLHA